MSPVQIPARLFADVSQSYPWEYGIICFPQKLTGKYNDGWLVLSGPSWRKITLNRQPIKRGKRSLRLSFPRRTHCHTCDISWVIGIYSCLLLFNMQVMQRITAWKQKLKNRVRLPAMIVIFIFIQMSTIIWAVSFYWNIWLSLTDLFSGKYVSQIH